MSRIGWVTCEKLQPWSERENLVIQSMLGQGHEIIPIVWSRTDQVLESFDWIIIRTPWDYFEHLPEFKKWIESLPEGKVLNSKRVLLWNLDKVYLKELAEKGIPVVPTVFLEVTEETDLTAAIRSVQSDEVVIKPSQSASSHLTYVVKQNQPIAAKPFVGKTILIQPKLQEIIDDGECSMVFFGGVYSHAVLKKPKRGDFRVQKSFGGTYSAYAPTPAEVAFGLKTVRAIPEPTLYARVDFVRLNGKPFLMELEVLEPDLFFEENPDSIGCFQKAFQHIENTDKFCV